jgi:hypothetical protein
MVPSTALEYHVIASKWRYATLIATGPKASAASSLSADIRANVDEDGTLTAVVCGGDQPWQVAIAKQVADGESVAVTATGLPCAH